MTEPIIATNKSTLAISNGSDPYRASAIRVALFIGVTLYAWATIWVLEQWRSAVALRKAAGSALP